MTERRWDSCVDHRGKDVNDFLTSYFAESNRKCIVVAGAGFDPRTTLIPEIFSRVPGLALSGLFIQEQRPSAQTKLRSLAKQHANTLKALVPNSAFVVIDVFAKDGAVVAGRNAVTMIRTHELDEITDVIIDMSALSIGTSFPLVRYFVELSDRRGRPNVHVMVASLPGEDEQRQHKSNDSVSIVHSFDGQLRLHSERQRSKLWIPQLSSPKKFALEKIFQWETWDDVCPILPFPSRNPRAADLIAEEFLREFDGAWGVDVRNIVYAGEDDPLDVYRTILDIEEQRQLVFEQTVGSSVVLSPVGSKAVAIGALMAALERSLPVVYVEALGYTIGAADKGPMNDPELLHVWLAGEAYPPFEGRA